MEYPKHGKQVEADIGDLVFALKKSMPNLREVRLFGSYNNSNWDPQTSDIDIGILIDGLNASEYPLTEVKNKFMSSYRFDIYTCTHYVWSSNYNTFNAMRNGRLLYRRRFSRNPLKWIFKLRE